MAGALTNPPRQATTPAPAGGEQTDDEAAMVELAKRDRRAFAPLYVRYFDLIYGYCYRRLGTADAAADATSQTFAKALAALPSCREGTFRAWLFAIAHNVLTDGYRSRRADRPLEEALDLPASTPSPEDLAIGAEERGRLAHLLNQLLPDQRRILELRLAGLTSKEIAVALGRTPNAVDQAQFRALARLRSLLSGAERSPEGAR